MHKKECLDELIDKDLNDMISAMSRSQYNMYYNNAHGKALISIEDLEAEAFVGVVMAYKTFDPLKGKFRTWAYPYIKKALSEYCGKFCHSLSISRREARTELPSMLGIGVIHIDQLAEDTEFEIPTISGIHTIEDTKDFLYEHLSSLERTVIEDKMIHKYSLRALAEKYDVSIARISRIVKRGTRKLKVKMKEYVETN